MPQVTIKGKVYRYETVGQTNAKGYKRISRRSELYQRAAAILGSQASYAVWLHGAICAIANGKPPGQIGIGRGKYSCDHTNGISTDNRPANLRWMLHSENTGKGNASRE